MERSAGNSSPTPTSPHERRSRGGGSEIRLYHQWRRRSTRPWCPSSWVHLLRLPGRGIEEVVRLLAPAARLDELSSEVKNVWPTASSPCTPAPNTALSPGCRPRHDPRSIDRVRASQWAGHEVVFRQCMTRLLAFSTRSTRLWRSRPGLYVEPRSSRSRPWHVTRG